MNERRFEMAPGAGSAEVGGVAMPNRIVTYVHRPKRSPREKPMVASISVPVLVKTPTEPKGQRSDAWIDDGQETSPEIKAFFARMMRPHGS